MASDEQGSCGIRRKLLTGGSQRQFAVSQVLIENARPHFHRKTWELYVVQEGKGALILNGVSYPVRQGDVLEIPPMVVHQAIPDPMMKVLVVMSPYNAEMGDIEYV